MPDEMPTIPQIVRALITLNDRQSECLQSVRDEYNEVVRTEERRRKDAEERLAVTQRQAHNASVTIEGLNAVIETLSGMLDTIHSAAGRDERDAVMMEPGDVFRMAKVNIGALRAGEIRKAKERAKRAPEGAEAQEPIEPENGPQEAVCVHCGHLEGQHHHTLPEEGYRGYCAECGETEEFHEFADRLCTKCGKDDEAHIMWAQRHLPEFPEDLDPRIVEARKGLRQGEADAQAKLDVMRAHLEAEQPPDDLCVCGHERNRHFDGSCHDCARDEYDHEFKLAVL
jgi:hypothetical protein